MTERKGAVFARREMTIATMAPANELGCGALPQPMPCRPWGRRCLWVTEGGAECVLRATSGGRRPIFCARVVAAGSYEPVFVETVICHCGGQCIRETERENIRALVLRTAIGQAAQEEGFITFLDSSYAPKGGDDAGLLILTLDHDLKYRPVRKTRRLCWCKGEDVDSTRRSPDRICC